MNIWIIDGSKMDQALRRLQTDYDLSNKEDQLMLLQRINALEWVRDKAVRVNDNQEDTSQIELQELVKQFKNS